MRAVSVIYLFIYLCNVVRKLFFKNLSYATVLVRLFLYYRNNPRNHPRNQRNHPRNHQRNQRNHPRNHPRNQRNHPRNHPRNQGNLPRNHRNPRNPRNLLSYRDFMKFRFILPSHLPVLSLLLCHWSIFRYMLVCKVKMFISWIRSLQNNISCGISINLVFICYCCMWCYYCLGALPLVRSNVTRNVWNSYFIRIIPFMLNAWLNLYRM